VCGMSDCNGCRFEYGCAACLIVMVAGLSMGVRHV